MRETQGSDDWREQRLDAFYAEPVFQWLRSRGMARGHAIWLLTPVLALLSFGASAIQGTLRLSNATTVWRLDASKILFRNRYSVADYGGETLSLSFPLGRDYPTIMLYVVISLWLYILFRQWVYMERFLPELIEQGCLRPKDGEEKEFTAAIRTANERLAIVRSTGELQLLGSFFLALFIVFAHHRAGVFGVLAPVDARNDWAVSAYGNWWASLPNPLGFSVYVAVAVIVMYYVVKQNWVGWIVILGLKRLNRCSDIGVDIVNPDGWYGWSIFRKTMVTVVVSMAIVGFTLIVLMMIVSLRQFYWLVAFLLVFFVTSPIFILPPLAIFRRRVREHKSQAIAGFTAPQGQELGSAIRDDLALGELPSSSQLVRGLMVDRYRAVREVPFRWPGALAGLLAYFVQLGLALGAWSDIR